MEIDKPAATEISTFIASDVKGWSVNNLREYRPYFLRRVEGKFIFHLLILGIVHFFTHLLTHKVTLNRFQLTTSSASSAFANHSENNITFMHRSTISVKLFRHIFRAK